MQLVKDVYRISNKLPGNETFGLAGQIRRSAVSIPSNIAEGSGRGSDKEFRRFIEIALGSSFELETQLLLANDIYRLGIEMFQSLIDSLGELQRVLYF